MSGRKRWIGARHAIVLAAALLAGCGDRNDGGPLAAARTTTTTDAQAAVANEEKAAADVAHAVALALTDEGLRHRVYNDLRQSPFREHKLEFASYLHGSSGGILLAKMASATGRSREQVLALLGSVRPLEFYLPVKAQRDRWAGEGQVIVATQLQEKKDPVGFAVGGQPVQLSVASPPATPVLVLVPVETDFSAAGMRKPSGVSGTLFAPECDPMDPSCNGGGDGGTVTYTPGLYMTASHISDLGEAWTKGAPEIEVMVLTDATADQSVAQVSCASETASGLRYFNQDGHDWGGRVLLFTQDQATQYNLSNDHGFTLSLWEDDYKPCTIVTNIDYGVLARAAAYYGFGMGAIVHDWTTQSGVCYHDDISPTMCLITFVWAGSKMWRIAEAVISTNDDHVGVGMLRSTIPNPGYDTYTHILTLNEDGSSRNGAIKTEWVN